MEPFYIPPAIKNIKYWEGEVYSPFVQVQFNLIRNFKLYHNAFQLIELEYLQVLFYTTNEWCYLTPWPYHQGNKHGVIGRIYIYLTKLVMWGQVSFVMGWNVFGWVELDCSIIQYIVLCCVVLSFCWARLGRANQARRGPAPPQSPGRGRCRRCKVASGVQALYSSDRKTIV